MLVDKVELLRYEIHASWWASWIGYDPFHSWVGYYFVWKVNRKYARYKESIEEKQHILENGRLGDD